MQPYDAVGGGLDGVVYVGMLAERMERTRMVNQGSAAQIVTNKFLNPGGEYESGASLYTAEQGGTQHTPHPMHERLAAGEELP